MARLRPLAAVAVAVAAVLASGCAGIPTQGRPTEVRGSGQQGQPAVEPLPPAPQAGMNELEIVQAFIAASASFADKHAAARAFLSKGLARSWRPGWAAAVVSGLTSKAFKPVGPVNVKGLSGQQGTVTVTAHQVATISNVGQYLNTPGSTVYKFHLTRVANQWRITTLPSPSSVLLLTQADFQEDYQPRNLYVWAPDGKSLVPEPAFAPQEGTYTTASLVAQNLINALLTNHAQSSWLGSATRSMFPSGTKLLGVNVEGQTATVNLGGSAARASPSTFNAMAAQLVVTLTSTSYAQPAVAGSVTLEVNGRVRPIGGHAVIYRERYAHLVPGAPSGLPLYFIGSTGLLTELRPSTPTQPIQKPLTSGQRPFGLIAVSGDVRPQFAGTLASAGSGSGAAGSTQSSASGGCVIYYGPLSELSSLHHQAIPIPHSGPCTSVGWDRHGNIWAVAGDAIWVLPPGSRQPTEVPPPTPPGGGTAANKVLSLSMAPDGVRVALLIKNPDGSHQVALSAITGTGTNIAFGAYVTVGASLADPIALSWYDADHVIVLSRSQLYEVPINGGAPIPAGPAPGATLVAAAGPGQVATAGDGEILTSSGPNQSQQPTAKGTSPAYPG